MKTLPNLWHLVVSNRLDQTYFLFAYIIFPEFALYELMRPFIYTYLCIEYLHWIWSKIVKWMHIYLCSLPPSWQISMLFEDCRVELNLRVRVNLHTIILLKCFIYYMIYGMICPVPSVKNEKKKMALNRSGYWYSGPFHGIHQVTWYWVDLKLLFLKILVFIVSYSFFFPVLGKRNNLV